MVNKVILLGNVGQDPVTKILDGGNQVTSISIATSKNWKDKNSGEKKTETQWHSLILWNNLSKVAEQYIKKGAKIYVEGELTHRSYNDNNNEKRYITEVVVKDLKMLGEPSANITAAPSPKISDNPADEEDDLPF